MKCRVSFSQSNSECEREQMNLSGLNRALSPIEAAKIERFSNCLTGATFNYKKCKKFSRCDQRLFESKSKCDEKFRLATNAH